MRTRDNASILRRHPVGWLVASEPPKISARKTKQWLIDNKEAIDNCNQYANEYGLFADKHRLF